MRKLAGDLILPLVIVVFIGGYLGFNRGEL